MGRVLDPELQALIDTGHVESHTAVKITLGDGTDVFFATAQFEVGEDLFIAELEETESLKMSLTAALDRAGLKVQNVDHLFGQQLTSASDALDGATAILGIAFRKQDGSGPWYYDEKMPGDIIAGEVAEQSVGINFVGETYGALVVGDTVSSVFPYQQDSRPTVVISDPNDLLNPNPDPTGSDEWGRIGRGRIPLLEFNLM